MKGKVVTFYFSLSLNAEPYEVDKTPVIQHKESSQDLVWGNQTKVYSRDSDLWGFTHYGDSFINVYSLNKKGPDYFGTSNLWF